jgi:uncharacterized cofD-like protein
MSPDAEVPSLSGLFPGASVDSSESASPGKARVVAFGGGTGMAALLRGLKRYTGAITAVATVTDNGGSSGRLRSEFDIAAPGDLRNCLIALADIDPLIAKVFQYRFDEAEFSGHNFGNLFITVLSRVVGGFDESIRELNRLLQVRGSVIPACATKVSLVAHHPDDTKSTGEVEITRSGKRIDRIELRPRPVPVSPEIRAAIRAADVFVFGPGSLYTSVIPNLLLDGIVEAIRSTGKPRIYIGNIMTQPGETVGYRLSDHLRALRRHSSEELPDVVIAHDGRAPPEVLRKYAEQGAVPVIQDLAEHREFQDVRVIEGDFLASEESETSASARHDSDELARTIYREFLEPLDAAGTAGMHGDPGTRHASGAQ